MNRHKSIRLSAAAILAAISLCPVNAFAKSFSLINPNMDHRRSIINQPELKLYVKTFADNYPYYGAKFEPRSGIYIGTPYDRSYPGINNAINTLYNWFVPREEILNENCPRQEIAEQTSDHDELWGINLNFSLKNDKVIDVRDYSNWLCNLIDEYSSWGKDILLIFGKEMNIDDNFNDPELFKECFRFVADYAHTKENIAMVWAPNDMGGLDTTFEEFYPGDKYVDWIGCSLYTMPYFQGKINGEPSGNLFFLMNSYAHPAIHAKMLHEFMEEKNIKKPVFITEGGVGFESPDGVDYTGFAKHQVRSYYSDICRRYPEFKCIVSFNQYVKDGDLYRYDMSNNPELLPLIQELTSDPIYLKTYPSSSDYSFFELFNGMEFTDRVQISAYAYIPGVQNLVVRYLLDGEWLTERKEPPYEIDLGNEFIPYGKHRLTCEIYDGSEISQTTNYDISLVPGDTNYSYADVSDDGKCPFTDMDGDPAEMRNSAAFLAGRGIVNGVDGVNFASDKKISRYQAAAMLTRLLGLKESSTPCGLEDMSEDDWYYGIVNAAVENGIITGYDDNCFHGDRAIKRKEFISIASKIIRNKKSKKKTEDALSYADKIDEWVVDDVKLAREYGVLLERPDNIFYGDGYVSRGDAAVMIKRLYDVLNED